MGSAHDYDRSLWSSRTDVNHARAQQAGLTAEVVTAMSTPFNDKSCFLVESAIRQGYRMTIMTSPFQGDDTQAAFSNHEKERLSSYYGRLQRERILQRELGVPNPLFNLGNYTKADVQALQPPAPGSAVEAALVEYLLAHPHLYLFTDAFDALVQLSPIELHRRVRANWPTEGDTEEYFVVSAEANQTPPIKTREWYPDSRKHMFPFVNSGLWIARLDRMIRFTEHVANSSFAECTGFWSYSDQCKMMAAISDPAHRFTEFQIPRDLNSSILQNMMPASERQAKYGLREDIFRDKRIFHPAVHLGMTPEGLITRRDAAITPVALHWNGPSKRFNEFNQPINANTTAVDFTVYKNLGWMRRPIAPGGEKPYYFHLSRAEVETYLSVYDVGLQLNTTLRDDLFTQCTANLGNTINWYGEILQRTGLATTP